MSDINSKISTRWLAAKVFQLKLKYFYYESFSKADFKN